MTFTASAERRYTLGFDAPFDICMLGGEPTGAEVQYRVNGALIDTRTLCS